MACPWDPNCPHQSPQKNQNAAKITCFPLAPFDTVKVKSWYLLPRLHDTGMSRVFYDFYIELSEMELIVLK